MAWKLIDKSKTERPSTGTYSDWKQILADEGFNQCVYCYIGEGSQGIRNFHVEHFRPKSKFKELENDFDNLFYSCPICNCFKSNDWPDPKDGIQYADPSKIDLNSIFEVDQESAIVSGKDESAIYVIEKLFLNRPQLILERKQKVLIGIFENERKMIEKLINNLDNKVDGLVEILRENLRLFNDAIKTLEELLTSIPYDLKDTKRVK